MKRMITKSSDEYNSVDNSINDHDYNDNEDNTRISGNDKNSDKNIILSQSMNEEI